MKSEKKYWSINWAVNSEVYQESLSVNYSRRLSVVRLSSLKIRLVLISSSAIANHDVYRPPSFIWRLAASPLVARVLGFSCKNKRLLAVYNHSDISLNDNDHPREGGGDSTNVYTRRLRPGVKLLTFYISFFTTKVPLLYTFYWQMIPPFTYKIEGKADRTYLVYNFAFLLTSVNALSVHKNRTFNGLYKARKFIW